MRDSMKTKQENIHREEHTDRYDQGHLTLKILHYKFLGYQPKEHASTKRESRQRIAHLHHYFQESFFVLYSTGEIQRKMKH